MFCWNLLACVFFSVTPNLLSANGSFEHGLEAWEPAFSSPVTAEALALEGRTAVRLVVPSEAPIAYPSVRQAYPVTPGVVVSASVDALGRNICDGAGVYISVEFLGADGGRISFVQSEMVIPDGTWRPLRIRGIAPPESVSARLCLLLNGHGEACFTGVKVTAAPGEDTSLPDGPVILTVTNEIVCPSLKGFGAEDDGWFYNEVNAAKGVAREDWTVREDRVRWMESDWVRMFFWYKDWNPSGDWETFDFDSDNMRSHYRTLDLYQSIDAYVNVVGVEWGMSKFDNLEKTAKAIGALLEHLVLVKGYSCVQEWTLTNEPNGSWTQRGSTFEEYLRLHELVKEEFHRRGLAIRILGSDDTSGLSWFENCVQSDRYLDCADFFASHLYARYTDRHLAPFFFDDRLDLLRAHAPNKPLVIAEFGFQDHRSGTLENPLMEYYPYALWTTDFVIKGLNRGIAGFCIWCLHEVYYPGGGFMNYGLWNFKDRNWAVRPVYTAWSNLTRHTKTGNTVYRCDSTAPGYVLAVRVGDTLFWVNQADLPVQARILGVDPVSAHAYTESTLSGDRECGITIDSKDSIWPLPAKSFGRMNL